MWKAEIKVLLKKSVLDPQGQAVEKALSSLGYGNVQDVRIGKYLEVSFAAGSHKEAEDQVREMSERLLTNPVIEDYTFELVEV
ncbi:MAG: phosphoribosylformylglycinamidine synthase subunit PurS [Dethiobacter sp.]|jgi:phosphoribosylformylglycinamidine synthase|nr:phosphoribosylformylglycinamidine synthase subunit PurS [Dethiobacter sp.]MBS3900296.1 phosphoribosylformylglycinamidine synthase subunit PurS [Dethiobacter sp.]MBS3982685.1 phosphoribosylformylglycinamidine synthase subunit PurS [Dethiobacter sp.]MCL4462897.1 phosphoribosylformylglycinamidine synthase subunit PurS [Bacillota bacterium]MCL5993410.1 phosphoribosylformylglycinamidine synthase subunit PurS [Bacillota bacterium]